MGELRPTGAHDLRLVPLSEFVLSQPWPLAPARRRFCSPLMSASRLIPGDTASKNKMAMADALLDPEVADALINGQSP